MSQSPRCDQESKAKPKHTLAFQMWPSVYQMWSVGKHEAKTASSLPHGIGKTELKQLSVHLKKRQ